ncbi:hypothetical protein [Dokdonella sp.]|uniref:hypothetical protein n=1 Tax=Dokdonella sp. TaxID=2291710 RepID=UPI002F3EEA30
MPRRTTHARAVADIAELAFLVPVVVAQRTLRATQQRDQKANAREARRMLTEKVGATTEAMFAIAASAVRAQIELAALFARGWMPGTASMAAFMRASTADLSAKAVAPYLRKARSNARRLAR